MFDIIELNGKKVAELREIAGKLGIARIGQTQEARPRVQHLGRTGCSATKAKPSLPTRTEVLPRRPRAPVAPNPQKPQAESPSPNSNGRRPKKSEEPSAVKDESPKAPRPTMPQPKARKPSRLTKAPKQQDGDCHPPLRRKHARTQRPPPP